MEKCIYIYRERENEEIVFMGYILIFIKVYDKVLMDLIWPTLMKNLSLIEIIKGLYDEAITSVRTVLVDA